MTQDNEAVNGERFFCEKSIMQLNATQPAAEIAALTQKIEELANKL